MRKSARQLARKRTMTNSEIAEAWAAFEAGESAMSGTVRTVVMLSMLTGQRRIEVCGAKRSEVILDGSIAVGDAEVYGAREVEAPVWIIPDDIEISIGKQAGTFIEGRTKSGREQVLPRSRQAAELDKLAMQAHGNEHIYPSGHTVKVGRTAVRLHVHEDNITKAMIRFGRKIEFANNERRKVDAWLLDRAPQIDVKIHDRDKPEPSADGP